jgi:hypothetical protein
MTAISKVIKGLKFIESHQQSILREILIENSEEIEKLQTDQLLRGKTNEGKNISPKYRNKRYANKKQAMNPKPPKGVPDLKLTGKYHKGFKVKIGTDSGKFVNTDPKDKRLSKKYEKIKGLSPVSIGELRQIALIEFRRRTKKAIFA